jgi:hypothetical protein
MAVRLMTTATTEATTVVEYGVKLTWPDGHTETQKDVRGTRDWAEGSARNTNRMRSGDGPTAEVVRREVTTTPWEVAS